jgi:hypothetical protein
MDKKGVVAEINKIKKKLGAFYKISFSIIVIASIMLFYFAALVSGGPKSFSYVTEKIEKKIVENFGAGASIENSYISFTAYGSLRIAVTGLNIFYASKGEDNREFFTIPRLEAEFSLFNFLFFNFQPTKIKVVRPMIVVNDVKNLQFSNQGDLSQEGQLSAIMSMLAAIRSGENPIENFEIENAKFVLFNGANKNEVVLKRAQIQAVKKGGIVKIISQNQLSFDEKKSDVNLDTNCQLSKGDGLSCDLFLKNFSPDSISNLHISLIDLGKLSGVFSSNISLAVKDGELRSLLFKVRSDVGSFNFSQFFPKEIYFRNFAAAGEYDHKLGALNVSSIETDLVDGKSVENQTAQNPHLSMSVVLSGINSEEKKSSFYIKLQNVLTSDVAKFWPLPLDQNDVRSWVVEHVKDGIVKNAYAKFSLAHGAETTLENIDAEMILSGVTLDYDSGFPKISNISAIANFTEKDMKIIISDGDVLASKISKTLVQIEDFDAEKIILKISGELKGKAADGLKHASNHPDFITEVDKYLNGNAVSKFDVRIGLSEDEITLKNSYIAAQSTMIDLNNSYLRGGALIHTKKDFNSNNFVTDIDLTAAEITAKEFDITKKIGIASSLNFTLLVKDDDNLQINKIMLTSQENNAKISGNIDVNTQPFFFSKVELRNENFGKNNFSLSYSDDAKTAIKKVFIKGSKLNLGALVENQAFKKFEGSGNLNLNLEVRATIAKLELLHNKSIRNYSLSLNCKNNICFSGMAKGSYAAKDSLNFIFYKKKKEEFATMTGSLSNLGYLAEGFGISNVVSGGNAKIKIENSVVQNKPVFEGEVEVDEDVTIYETTTVKRLAKDDLFSKIKDKIFSSEKTTFDSVKIKFDFKGNILTIHSLIANNYKIGITAKGFFDVKNSTYQLRGMIIPGFLINNLFGIGNIPILGSLLTGGEGGGVFGLRYEYAKNKGDKEGKFSTNKVAAFVPSTIQNLFDF